MTKYRARWEAPFHEKFEGELPAQDLHLVVGNLASHRQTFLIIGLVYPPRVEMDRLYFQQSLDFVSEQRPVASATNQSKQG